MSSKEPSLSPIVESLKSQANELFKQGDFNKAHEVFTSAIAQEARSAALYSNRSATAIKLKNYHAALKDSQKAVKLDPNWGKVHARVATAQELLCQWQEAITSYRTAAALERAGKQKDEYTASATRVEARLKVIVDDRLAQTIKSSNNVMTFNPATQLQMLREQGHKYEQDSAAFSFTHTFIAVRNCWQNIQKLRKVDTMPDGTALPFGAQYRFDAPPTVLDDMMALVANALNDPNAFMYPGHEHWTMPLDLVMALGTIFTQISTLPKADTPSAYIKFIDAMYRRRGWENTKTEAGARAVIACAIRLKVLMGFCMELMTADFGSAYVHYNWAYQLIKLGREKWPQMWTATQAGTSFSQTFQRGVRSRMLECKIGLASRLGVNDVQHGNEIEAIAAEQLRSCQQYPVQRPTSNDVGLWQTWMGFDVTIRAHAYMALAFVNRSRAARALSKIGRYSYLDAKYGRLAMENYLKAACLFPEDDRNFAKAMVYALEMQMYTGDVSLAAMDSMIEAIKASEAAYNLFHGPLAVKPSYESDFVLEYRKLLARQGAILKITDPKKTILKRVPHNHSVTFKSSIVRSGSSPSEDTGVITITDAFTFAKQSREKELASITNGVFVDE